MTSLLFIEYQETSLGNPEGEKCVIFMSLTNKERVRNV